MTRPTFPLQRGDCGQRPGAEGQEVWMPGPAVLGPEVTRGPWAIHPTRVSSPVSGRTCLLSSYSVPGAASAPFSQPRGKAMCYFLYYEDVCVADVETGVGEVKQNLP